MPGETGPVQISFVNTYQQPPTIASIEIEDNYYTFLKSRKFEFEKKIFEMNIDLSNHKAEVLHSFMLYSCY